RSAAAYRSLVLRSRAGAPPCATTMPKGDSGEMNDLLFQSATETAEMLRRKAVSSRELTERLLARIDAINPAVNAVVELRRESALQEAAAADEALAHGVLGPLHGLPMTIKESFNVAGLHTTWGNPAFKEYVADSDAT